MGFARFFCWPCGACTTWHASPLHSAQASGAFDRALEQPFEVKKQNPRLPRQIRGHRLWRQSSILLLLEGRVPGLDLEAVPATERIAMACGACMAAFGA